MKTADRKPNIVLFVAGVLLFLTLLSLYVTTGLYAKYISSSSTEDSAHTAAFYIEAKGSLLTRSFQIENAVPGRAMQKELEIVNKSEVKLKYTLTVQNETNNLPLDFAFTCNDAPVAVTPESGKWVIEKTLDTGGTTDRYVINVIWAESAEEEDENLQYMGMLDHIVVTLEAVQVD